MSPRPTSEIPTDPDYPALGKLGGTKSAAVASVPPKYRATFLKAISGTSRKASIRSACLECMGFSAQEVAKCSRRWCPLYPWRLKG